MTIQTTIEKLNVHTLTLELIHDLFYTQKMYETSYENSLFKKILSACLDNKSLIPLTGHTLYLMKNTDNNETIGLSMIKSFEKEIIPLFKLKDSFRSNSRIGTIYNKEFVLQDWFQIYIKPIYRKKGLAVSLLHFVENDLIEKYQLNAQQVPLIIGKGLAYDLINKKAKFFFALAQDKNYTNKVYDLSHMTNTVINYVFEPVGNKSFLANFNQQFLVIAKEDKNNQLKDKILGIKKIKTKP